MGFAKLSCETFVDLLASKDPVPGGGGASALVGALGTALGNMVGSLTLGKKKYAAVEEDIHRLKAEADSLQQEFLNLVDKDAEVFQPLAEAYGMPKDTEAQQLEKDRVMEEALRLACSVPLEIMEKSCQSIQMQKEFAEKGSTLALSDAGVGALFCKAALQGASLNVFINTGLMKDRIYAEKINSEAEAMLEQFGRLADEVHDFVVSRIR